MMNWEEAACIGYDLEFFFPPNTKSRKILAIEVCNTCPLIEACLEFAMAVETGNHNGCGTRFGVWGGKTPGERYGLQKRRERDRLGLTRTSRVG